MYIFSWCSPFCFLLMKRAYFKTIHSLNTDMSNDMNLKQLIWIHSPHFSNVARYENQNMKTQINTLRPGQNGRHFADEFFKLIFLYQNFRNSNKIPLKFVPKCPINNLAFAQIMAWYRPCDKSLSEGMMVSFPTHICVTRPQWVSAMTRFWWKLIQYTIVDPFSKHNQTIYSNYGPVMMMEYSNLYVVIPITHGLSNGNAFAW